MRDFRIFVGLDQTGARTANGKAYQPLPSAVLYRSLKGRWVLDFAEVGTGTRGSLQPLGLPSLTKEALLDLLQERGLFGRDLSQTCVLVDAVLGWPQGPENSLSFNEAFKLSVSLKDKSPHLKAHEIFSSLQGDSPNLRACDVQAKAHSLFQPFPFQRNISAGTLRVWSDLQVNEPGWFHWGHRVQSEEQVFWGPTLFESFPTLVWKQGLRSERKAARLVQQLKSDGIQFDVDTLLAFATRPDTLDAIALAWFGWKQQCEGKMWDHEGSDFSREEGWIFGLPSERPQPACSQRTLAKKDLPSQRPAVSSAC